MQRTRSLELHKLKFGDPQSVFLFLKHFENDKAKSLTGIIECQILTLVDQENSWSLLHMCANTNNIEMAKYYLEMVKNQSLTIPTSATLKWINQKDREGFTCLHYAVFRGIFPLVELFEEYGADIYQINGEGLTMLHIAAQADSPLLIYYFLTRGLKIDVKDFKGNTSLHWACYSGMENAVAALISWDAELDKREDRFGMTPLHLAVISGNYRIVKKLLMKGSDKKMMTYTGKKALDIARQSNYENIVEIIEDKKSICDIFMFKTPMKKPVKFGIHFYFFLWLFLSSYFLNMANAIVSFDFHRLTLVGAYLGYIIMGGLVFSLFLCLVLSDPGKLENHIYRHRQIFHKLTVNKPGSICFDCGIVKPQRSKHCQVCSSCISVYDHHCPWLGNCIGANNFGLFYFFVAILLVFILYNFGICIATLCNINDMGALGLVSGIYGLILSLIFVVPILLLLILHTQNAIQNRTTYESYKKPEKKPLQNKDRGLSSTSAYEDSLSHSLKSYDVETHSVARSSTTRTRKESQKQDMWVENSYQMCCLNRKSFQYRVRT